MLFKAVQGDGKRYSPAACVIHAIVVVTAEIRESQRNGFFFVVADDGKYDHRKRQDCHNAVNPKQTTVVIREAADVVCVCDCTDTEDLRKGCE